MKYLCLTSYLCLVVILLSSCKQTEPRPISNPPEQPVISTLDLPISLEAPGMSLQDAIELKQIKQFIELKKIAEDELAQYLVAEEIEKALGAEPAHLSSPLPDRQYRYWAIGQQAMANYRLAVFLRESIDDKPKNISVCVRTFCYDKTLMGHIRLAHWDEATGTVVSGKIDEFREVNVQIGDEATQVYQINKFGKFVNTSR